MIGTLHLWFELQSAAGCLHHREGNGEHQSVVNSEIQQLHCQRLEADLEITSAWLNVRSFELLVVFTAKWLLPVHFWCSCCPFADTHYLTCRIQECSETKRSGPFSRSIDVSSLVVQDEYIFIQVRWLHPNGTWILPAQCFFCAREEAYS